VFPAIANSGGSQNDEEREWNSTDRTLDGRRLDDGTRGDRGVAAVKRIRNISGTGDRSVHQLPLKSYASDNSPVGTLVTPKTPSTVLVLLARTSPLTSTSSIGRNSATTTVLEAFVSVASGCRNIRAWVVVSRKKARG
jgi:hypothetical protein